MGGLPMPGIVVHPTEYRCQSSQTFQRAAVQQELTYRVRGMLTDGFDSTPQSMGTLFPVAS
jgi:hypothetical protein